MVILKVISEKVSLWSPSELDLFELVNVASSKHAVSDRVQHFITLELTSSEFQNDSGVNKFQSICKLNTVSLTKFGVTEVKNLQET